MLTIIFIKPPAFFKWFDSISSFFDIKTVLNFNRNNGNVLIYVHFVCVIAFKLIPMRKCGQFHIFHSAIGFHHFILFSNSNQYTTIEFGFKSLECITFNCTQA